MSKPEGYQEVAERIHAFYEKHPTGSIRTEHVEFVQIAGNDYVLVRAAVYRSPDDVHPGTGTAMEPIPGKTPFTKGSEVENGETSAWGRALASLGLGGRKIATADEVQAKRAQPVRDAVQVKDRVAEFRALCVSRKLSSEQVIEALSRVAPGDVPSTAQARRGWISKTVDGLDDLSYKRLVAEIAA